MNIFIEKLTKQYDNKLVLNIDSLDIEHGSLLGIIGPNGAGKSTLINIVAGLETQTAGHVYYGNRNHSIPPLDIMTLVFQTPYLIRTTVEKNIAYPLKLRNWSLQQIEERVSELSEDLGLTPFRKQKSWKLSGGETQKVALARALSFRPKLLLLDEPTANIDPGTTGEIERMLKKISGEGKTTIVIITHNLAQAKRICTHVAFLNQGVLTEYGKSEQVLKHPANELTQKFLSGELLT